MGLTPQQVTFHQRREMNMTRNKSFDEAYHLQTPVYCKLVYGYQNCGVVYVLSIFKVAFLDIGAYTAIYIVSYKTTK